MRLCRSIIWHYKTTSSVLRLETYFKTFLIMPPREKKLISYVMFHFCEHHHKSASSLQFTYHLRYITNCYHGTREIACPNFNIIPCLELEVYTQRTNLCFYKTLKKIVNFSYSQIGIGPMYRNILCVSVWIYSNNALLLLVQLNQVLLLRRR